MAAVQAVLRAPAAGQRSAACRQALRPRPAAPLARPAAARPAVRRQQAGVVRAVLDVTTASFEQEVLQASRSGPVLVEFWAAWCGPCKLMAPMLAWAEKEYGGAVKVTKMEADANKPTLEEYKVYGLPCFILFKDGAQVEGSFHEGAMTKKQLGEYLEKHGVKAGVAA